ncbi:hypothetical protein PR048_014319 [Dryococelus australis]|uniref:Uncharacterized protein n=1 Tax=Dryococelus australis TaxID=614101 RepID=A0ABQ9HDX9_9NEOP|nr:hypothetical protein PR048_014319 [Dryococelus australis]
MTLSCSYANSRNAPGGAPGDYQPFQGESLNPLLPGEFRTRRRFGQILLQLRGGFPKSEVMMAVADPNHKTLDKQEDGRHFGERMDYITIEFPKELSETSARIVCYVRSAILLGMTLRNREEGRGVCAIHLFIFLWQRDALPDFRKWESRRTMPLVGGFSRGSPVSLAPSFQRRSIFTSIIVLCSHDLSVKSRPNLFTHSLLYYLVFRKVGRNRRPVPPAYLQGGPEWLIDAVAMTAEIKAVCSDATPSRRPMEERVGNECGTLGPDAITRRHESTSQSVRGIRNCSRREENNVQSSWFARTPRVQFITWCYVAFGKDAALIPLKLFMSVLPSPPRLVQKMILCKKILPVQGHAITPQSLFLVMLALRLPNPELVSRGLTFPRSCTLLSIQGHAVLALPFVPTPEHTLSDMTVASVRNGGLPPGQSTSFVQNIVKPPSLGALDFNCPGLTPHPFSSLQTIILTWRLKVFVSTHFSYVCNASRESQLTNVNADQRAAAHVRTFGSALQIEYFGESCRLVAPSNGPNAPLIHVTTASLRSLAQPTPLSLQSPPYTNHVLSPLKAVHDKVNRMKQAHIFTKSYRENLSLQSCSTHQDDPSSIPGRVTPYFRMWESCWTMPFIGGFSRKFPVSPALSLQKPNI